MKKAYEKPELVIERLEIEDIIASGGAADPSGCSEPA